MPRTITVGVPVYRGADQVAACLRSLQEQTFADFDVVISVDAADEESARACEPFLDDERFSLVVQPERLDWHGNLNWLLQRPLGDYFCYRQHDDTTDPEFFQALVQAAEARPDAAIVYADCQWHGGRDDLETAPSIEGDVLARMRQHIEQKQPVAVRGLMRRDAVEQAGPIRGDEFRGLSEVFVWLAKLLRLGSVPPGAAAAVPPARPQRELPQAVVRLARRAQARIVDDPLHRADGGDHAGVPHAEERFFFQQLILDRVAVVRPGQNT